MPGLKERAKNLVELVDNAEFLFADRPLQIDPKALEALKTGGSEVLATMIPFLAALDVWDAMTTEAAVRHFAEEKGLKLGLAAQPLRAALTGRLTSPGIFEVLDVLGQHESLARLNDAASLG